MRGGDKDSMGKAKLLYSSTYIWALSADRIGWAHLENPVPCVRARTGYRTG